MGVAWTIRLRGRQKRGTEMTTHEAPAAVDDEGFEPAEWTYTGLRARRDGKAFHEWLDGAGASLWYSKGAPVVGGVYRIEVCSTDDTTTARFGSLQYLRKSDDARVPAWTMEHRAAQAIVEGERAEKRAQREAGAALGDLTLRELRAMYLNAMPPQAAGVLTTAVRYLSALRVEGER